MNKKLLLSALIALPMAASQIHAGTEVSLENEMRNYPETLSASESITSQNSAALIAAQELQMRPCKDTLSIAFQDVETISTKLAMMEELNIELNKLDALAKDAVERTLELNENHAALIAAKEFQRHVRKFKEESQRSHKETVDLLNKAKGRVNEIAEKIKKNNQQALELLETFNNALKQVRNPLANLDKMDLE